MPDLESFEKPGALSRRRLLAALPAAASWMAIPAGPLQKTESETITTAMSPATRQKMVDDLLVFAASVAPSLFRDPSGLLPYPSISPSPPGKAYSTQLWDWDTLWTAVGLYRLAAIRSDEHLRRATSIHLQGALENFFHYQSAEGRIPLMIATDKEDFFQSTAAIPHNPHNQAKPVMAQMALLLAEESRDLRWAKQNLRGLQKFHESWLDSNGSPAGLLVWGNDVAIGIDNDPTVFGRPDFSSASVFLNSLFYADVRAAAKLASRLGDKTSADYWSDLAAKHSRTIQEHCWDSRDKFFYTADVQCHDARSRWLPGLQRGIAMSWETIPLRIQTCAGFLPLWCGIATKQQAQEVIQGSYLADDRFRGEFGVRSLSNREPMYSLAPRSGNPSNWLGPVWGVANYMVWAALRDYGFDEAARRLRDATIWLLHSDLMKTGTWNEYYHPDTGAPLSHTGFIDWNLLVFAMD